MCATNVNFPEGALVISCDVDESTENVILRILGKESLPDCIEDENIKGYDWDLDTKYYTAKIRLYSMKEKNELTNDFSKAVKALIFYFDNQKLSSFDEVLSWMPFLKDVEAEVKLLVCNNYNDASESTALEKKNVFDWSVKNDFEIVEMNMAHESDDEDEQAFKDVKGYGRVVEALQSNVWNNMKLKKSSTSSSQRSESSKEDKKLEVLDGASKGEEEWLRDLASQNDGGDMDFEALFAKFDSMKEKAANLTGDERKKFAEEAAIAFWRAMGGDEDEIAGLDDED